MACAVNAIHIRTQYGTYTINMSNVLNFANKHGKSQAPEWLYQLTKTTSLIIIMIKIDHLKK